MCLFSNLEDPKLWWKYIDRVHELCGSHITEDCSKRVHSYINYPFAKTEACVKNSFYGENHAVEENKILH